MYRERINPHDYFDQNGLPKKKTICVKRYRKPDQTESGLHLPDKYLDDDSGRLWEVVWSSATADDVLGFNLKEDMILETRESFPAEDTGFEDERDGRTLFFMAATQDIHVRIF